MKRDFKKHNVSLRLLSGRYAFVDKERVSGWFDDGNPKKLKISVATGYKKRVEWLSVLAHEYNHLKQQVSNCAVHRRAMLKSFKTSDENEKFSGNIYNAYTIEKNKRIKKSDAKMALRRIVALEHDCEKRTIKMLKKSKCSQKAIDFYIKKSNADLFEYIFNFHYRHFKIGQKSVKKCHYIMTAMPDKLMPLDFYFKQFHKYKIFFEMFFL